MSRIFTTLSISIILISFLGCGVLTSLVGKEEWSDNYALMDGVTATAPEMIDGNLKTSGKTAFPTGADQAYATSSISEVVVTLPEKQSIYKVVIHSANLKTFDLMADKGDNNWYTVKEVKSVRRNPIEVRLSAITNKIRVRVKATTSDAEFRREREAGRGWDGGGTRRGNRRAPADISEIELYGYASSAQVASTAPSEEKMSEEDELDQLLNK